MVASSSKELTLALLADHHVAKRVFAFLQFFSPHSIARIAGSCSTRVSITYIVMFYNQACRMMQKYT